MNTPGWLWGVFAGTVALLLSADILVNRKRRHETRVYAVCWTAVFVTAGLAFGALVWLTLGADAGGEYVAVWLLELSLSLDNLFVFLLIFHSLKIERQFQRRALFWGVMGAIVFRALFIFAGAAALERWSWINWLFGATLLYAAWRALRQDPGKPRRSTIVEWLARRFPVTEHKHGEEFIAFEQGRRVITPLMLALIAIELTDIAFAVDSVPAALSVSRNVFVVYSADIFAVLGLRALYLLLVDTIGELRYLRYALATILGFTAFKLTAEGWIHIPAVVSVGFIIVALAIAIAASLRARRRETGSLSREILH